MADSEAADDVLASSAARAAELVMRRQVSSRELTELALARIDAVNPAVNAVVERRADAALSEAAAADRSVARNDSTGPLHGVPITVKEAIHVAGMHSTWGHPAFRDFLAERDASVVRRLRQAGAVIVGTTNAAFMLADLAQTRNDLYGVTNNPWDITRTPGGSSGGSAAAVATGMSFLDFGSDLAGSVRIPASFCGVYGLKPSVGTVPLTGFQPPGPIAISSEITQPGVVGPFARTAGDLRLALRATAGPEQPADASYSWMLPPPRRRRLGDFRVGVVADDSHAPVTAEVSAALAAAIDALDRAGATVVEGWPRGVDPAGSAELFGFQVGLFLAVQQSGQEDFAPLAWVVSQERRRVEIRTAWWRYFSDVDVFVCPTNFTPAFRHDPRPFPERVIVTADGARPYTDQSFWIAHASLAGLPAVAAPIGRTAAGLPVGMQILGPAYEDDTAITFAELLAELIGGYEPPPLVDSKPACPGVSA
jgi:amidase